jgi:glycosyltransferase involved in cell wall biosynthesis
MFNLVDYPLVSVIIPTYNRYSYLLNAINSVKNQTYKNTEIIIVNDCSSQQEYYTNTFDGCRVLHLKENTRNIVGYPCVGFVRNQGINIAKGKYIAFLDDDDEFLPHKLELQIKNLECHRDCLLSASEGLWGNGIYNKYKIYPLYNREHFWEYISNKVNIHDDYPDIINKDFLLKHNVIICSSVVINTNLLNNLQGFKNLPFAQEDYDLWLRCLQNTNCFYEKTPCVYYDSHHGDGQNY